MVEQVEVLHLDAKRLESVEPVAMCWKNRARSNSINAGEVITCVKL